MTELHEFETWPKIPRLRRNMVVTEKIDGTNAQITVRFPDATDRLLDSEFDIFTTAASVGGEVVVRAGSRNRWLAPTRSGDNYGFAAWVHENATILAWVLGEGRHYGEWYGQGIGRNYGLAERRFALFNTHRWAGELDDFNSRLSVARRLGLELDVVPILAQRTFDDQTIDHALQGLAAKGSALVPGFMRPEGVCVYHTASGHTYKILLVGDELPKGVTTRAERELAAAA